jgi:MFS transporter, DHA1 family, tetracycline resistance protein
VHGAANPVHIGMLHRQVDGPWRASVLSLNSMVSQPAGALGLVVLTAIAASAGTPAAILTGAVVLAVAAPLYLVGRTATTSSTVEFQQVA